MPGFSFKLFALLRGRRRYGKDAPPPLDYALSRGRRLRRLQSLGLILGGVVLIGLTMSRGGDPARALPPAAPVSMTAEEALEHASPADPVPEPAHVEAPTTQTLARPGDGSIPVTVTRSYPFIWPAEGPLTNEIGPWHPLGIDIGMDLGVESPVWAAARGNVTFAGGTEQADYGFHVIIDHGGGLVSLYGHMSEVRVQEGQSVRQGDLLGLGGDSGKAEGKHLHFEVKYNGSQINPQAVLPEQGAARPEALDMDCAQEALVIDSGAPTVLDFSKALSGSSIAEASLEAVNASSQALPSSVTKESDTSLLLDTSPTVRGTGAEDEYALKLMPRPGERELTCTVLVRTRSVRTVFYVRPTSTPTPVPPPEYVPPTSTPTNTPTPTPTPTPTKTPYPARR